jgi:hypothetical protein
VALTLEPGDEVRKRRCSHCGDTFLLAHGFVYRDEDAYAAYNVALFARHPDRCALLQVVIGDDWSEEAHADERVAVAVELGRDGHRLGARVIDGADTPWPGVMLRTRVLDRSEALIHPRLAEVFHVVDHIALQDPTVSAHFSRTRNREG